MILTVDIGNTNIHLGLFTRGQLRYTWTLATEIRRTSDEYSVLLRGLLSEDLRLEGAIISSVVPRRERPLIEAIRRLYNIDPMILDNDTPIGIVNGYGKPDEVGMDRLANAVGALHFYGAPILILDFGTAITLDYLAAPQHPDDLPIYKGGAIMPGIEMAAEALARGTARLPRVELFEPPTVIGRTTAESIQSGLIYGYMGAIHRLVDRACEEIGVACRVVATGGDAFDLKAHIPFLHAVDPDLTLYGLRQIWGLNHNHPLPRHLPRNHK